MLSGTKCWDRTPIEGISIEVGSEASRKSPMPLPFELAPDAPPGFVVAGVPP